MADEADRYWTEGTTVRVLDVHEHSLEAWYMCFREDDGGSDVLSGGDDLVLQCSRFADENHVPAVLWQDRKIHQAGVTAILPLEGDLLLTGSYDDHIRLVSAPSARGRRQVLAEHDLGGGVWRLRLLNVGTAHAASASASTALAASKRSLTILASCMHAGTRLVRLTEGNNTGVDGAWTFDVLAKFEEHKSMNYGGDVQPSAEAGGAVKTIVSTSFYDKLLCLWRVNIGAAKVT